MNQIMIIVYQEAEGAYGAMAMTIPAGANLEAQNLAAFNLTIKGDSTIPAGKFVSTVSIAYSYEQ